MCVTDTDAPYQRSTDVDRVLSRHEKRKKDKYLEACLARRRTFTPLIYSVDGMQGKEGLAATRRLAAVLAPKWHRPYSVVCNYVRARMSLALVRGSHRCLHYERNPLCHSHAAPWDNGDGLPLFR